MNELGELYRPRVMHLFAGAGGGILGDLLLGHQCICAVEIDNYCQQVLDQRQKDGTLPWFPIFDDIKEFDGKPWRGVTDIIAGGFPCQPFSVAGKQQGESDERNMWPDTIRVIREVRPRYCFLENVPNLLTHEYYGTILGDLAESGYNIRWRCLSAAEYGAPHKRTRLWIMAFSKDCDANRDTRKLPKEDEQQAEERQERRIAEFGSTSHVSDTESQGRKCREGRIEGEQTQQRKGVSGRGDSRVGWWDIDPADIPDTSEDGLQGGGEVGDTEGSLGLCDREGQDEIEDLPDTTSERLYPEEDKQVMEGEGGGELRSIKSRCDGSEEGATKSRLGRLVDELADRMGFIGTAFGGQIPRVATGVRNRVDRLKAIGNGQVPQVLRTAWELLNETNTT